MKFSLVLILPITFMLAACPKVPGEEEGGSKEKLAENFEINLHKDGGMMPVSENLKISKEECSWTYWRYRNETIVNWTATQEELEGLMQMLNKNDFRKIKSYSEEEVYDRGGYSITIKNGEVVTELNNSQRTFIVEKWIPKFKTIKKEILDYTNTKVFENKIYLKANLSENVMNSDLQIEIDFDEEMAYNSESEEINPFDGFKAFVGLNQVNLISYFKDSVSRYGGRVVKQQEMVFLTINKEDEEVFIDLIDDKLSVSKAP